ncbi:unannotated protein [freshwater metagenome]|uniref:Unannotated protein n=1 Tax=freshwater metagenome TaxID=449393 RepID=A0A6J6QK54_9ZZZZ
MRDLAAEVGLAVEDAERELQLATAQFSVAREEPTTSIRMLLESLRSPTDRVRWPRPSIVRRAGATRRRGHTAVGVVAAVAALLVTGTVVTDASGVRPTLARESLTSEPGRGPTRMPDPIELSEDALLPASALTTALVTGTWTVTDTHDNTAEEGELVPCQAARYADVAGADALVREFADAATVRAAYQLAEASRTSAAAKRAYATTASWYAGCRDPRTQLIDTYRVRDVGDQAVLLVLRSWQAPVTTLVVGVARTGAVVTTTMTQAPGSAAGKLGRQAELLGEAITQLCTLPEAGGCAGTPRLMGRAPLPVGADPAMLSEVDLPPVTAVALPWLGSEPRKATTNVAATRCDQASFSGRFEGARFTDSATRTFLVPGAGLPDTFGLTQTVGLLPATRAKAFVETVRSRLTSCPSKDLGTDVLRVARVASPDLDLTAWRLTTEITDAESITYYMAIARVGGAVSQIGFIPTPKVRMADGAFVALARRALARLPELS